MFPTSLGKNLFLLDTYFIHTSDSLTGCFPGDAETDADEICCFFLADDIRQDY